MMTDRGAAIGKAVEGRKHSLVNHSADEYVRYEEGIA
jgi:hypothetical protein